MSIITLTTDFGNQDHYVACMKGVILGINDEAVIVDLCHEVPPYDIKYAAMLLDAAYDYFPPGTIHIVVVDPGVGSSRKPLVVAGKKYFWVAPDNGVLSLALAREGQASVVEADNAHFFLSGMSATFHGRDIFAPLAAWLSKGIDYRQMGPIVESYSRMSFPEARLVEGKIQGEIIHVDRFGNLISNIGRNLWEQARARWGSDFRLKIGQLEIRKLVNHYAQAGALGEICALFGSSGRLELAINQGQADKILSLDMGQPLEISFA